MNKYSKKYIDKISSSKVYDVVIKTPITRAESVSSQFLNNIFLKREDLQPTHSFKISGAYNKISNDLELEEIHDKVNQEVKEAHEWAKSSPYPKKENLRRDIICE